MTIEYLTVDTIVLINQRYGGEGAGLVDRAGLEAAVHRPQSGSGDTDFFPDLWSKAAVLLHGLASTQYFSDGNKRTSWLAALTFLEVNGVEIRYVPGIEAEPFVLAVATSAFSVEQAAEWFRYQRVSEARLISAMLCDQVSVNGTFDIRGGGITYMLVKDVPCRASITAAVIVSAEFGTGDSVVVTGRVFGPGGEQVALIDPAGGIHTEVQHLCHLDKSGPAVDGEPWQQNLCFPYVMQPARLGRHRLELSMVRGHGSPKAVVSLPFAIARFADAELD
ncbi:type II toxin-antitoxin system death-on-curing family toxin [Nocardia sp. NPDC004260]